MRILLATLLHLAVAAALAAAVPPGPRCQGADGEPRLAGGWSPLAAKSAIPRKQVFPALVRFLKDSYEGEFEFEVCNGPSLTLDAACSQVRPPPRLARSCAPSRPSQLAPSTPLADPAPHSPQVVAGRNLQVVSTLTCPDRQPIKIQATLHLPLGEQPVEVWWRKRMLLLLLLPLPPPSASGVVLCQPSNTGLGRWLPAVGRPIPCMHPVSRLSSSSRPTQVIEFDAWQQPLKERRLPPRPVR